MDKARALYLLAQQGRTSSSLPPSSLRKAVRVEDLEWALHELRRNPDLFKIFVSPEVSQREML